MVPAPPPLAWSLFSARLLELGGLTLLVAEVVARIGLGAARLWRPAGLNALGRAGAGFLVGLPLVGLVNLGLGLSGLLRPGPLIAALGLLLILAPDGRSRRVLLLHAVREALAFGPAGCAALVLAVAPMLYALLTPNLDVDSLVYHLGAPSQFLRAGRILLEHVPFTFHVPLTIELAYALPLALGLDGFPQWLVFASLSSAAALWAGQCLRRGERQSAWLGPVLASSSAQILWLGSIAKIDMAAAAQFAGGAVLCASGTWALGGLLLGLALGSKFVYGPLIVLWAVIVQPPRRLWPWCLASLVLGPAAWWAKYWLATGDPVYPFATTVVPSFSWTAANRACFLASQAGLWPPDTLAWGDIPEALVHHLREDYPLLLAALPVLVVISPTRRTALALIAGQLVTLGTGHLSRYLLPSALFALFLAGRTVEWLPARARMVGAWILALVGLGFTAATPQARPGNWRDAFAPAAVLETARDTTFAVVAQALHHGGANRVIADGQTRTFGFPARFISGGSVGETPLLWQLARASRDLPELRRRYRQLGADRMLHNFVTDSWMDVAYQAFPWDDRALALHLQFCRAYLEPDILPHRTDYVNGGFMVYRLRRTPLAPAPATIWFAPGTEALYGVATAADAAHRSAEALDASRAAAARLPGVLHARNVSAHYEIVARDFKRAFADLAPGMKAGMMDFLNIPEFGATCVDLGRLDLAERVLTDSLDRYPSFRIEILSSLVRAQTLRAYEAYRRHDAPDAQRWIGGARAWLDRMDPNLAGPQGAARRQALAQVDGLEAEIDLVRGNLAGAAALFQEALRLGPELPNAVRWRTMVTHLPGAALQ